MFDKHGIPTVQDFSALMYKQYGVRVAILAGYVDAEGDPTITLYV
jgi:hypothetical protein